MITSSSSLKEIFSSIQLPEAEWIGLRRVQEFSTYRSARDQKPEANHFARTSGLMIEVMAQGQIGYAALPMPSDSRLQEEIQKAAERAYQGAVTSARFGIFHFKKEHREMIQRNAQGRYQSHLQRSLDELSPADINDLLIRITRELAVSPKIVRTSATLQTSKKQVDYFSSAGAEWTQEFHQILTSFEATAQEGSRVQVRSFDGRFAHAYQAGLEAFETSDLWENVRKVGEQAEELLSADECPTETSSLLLLPSQMILQIHESIGHPLELDRIIGDERNFAGWSFVKPSDVGQLQYGSPLMNVSFDPTIANEMASYAFDDSGAKAERALLIEKGVLKRALGGMESQVRSGVPGVANMRACDWNRPPIDRMANLNLEPGHSTLQEMIASVERGVMMDTNRSWSIDDFRNKFQFGCEYGKLIENGKITRTLRNPNYRGQTVPFWRNLTAVGNQDTFQVLGVSNCGKGEPNQSIRVGHATPPCLFKEIEVFGGGA